MKRLFTFIALVAMSIGAWAWTWTGTTPAGNNSYYMYNTARDRWMWDTQEHVSYGTYSGDALSTTTLKWTVVTEESPVSSIFRLVSANGKQFSQKDKNFASRIETNETGVTEAKRIDMRCALNNEGKYSLYFDQKVYNPGRNIKSTSDVRLETAADAFYEWLFVDDAEMAVYNNRFISFVANPIYEGENGTVDHVDATFELAKVGENKQPHAKTVTFKAVAKPGYAFAGWSETEGGAIVSTEENYEVELTFSGDVVSSNSITKTLYANFEVGVVTPVIEKVIEKLDWYTTYNVADLFTSTNTESALVVKNGEDVITSLAISNETAPITLTVSQAAVDGKFYAVDNKPFTFTVGAKDACDELGYVVNDATGKSDIENNNVLEYSWIKDNSLPFDEVNFDVTASLASGRTLHVSVYTDSWHEVYSKSGSATAVDITNEMANYANATAIRFEATGGLVGSATVKNVKIHVAAAELSAEQTSIDAETDDIANWSDEISVKYSNIATIQYEVTDVAATKGNATVVLTPQETIDNECGDFGYYHFAVSATCDEVGSTITANAHFYTADGKRLIIPVSLTFSASLSLVAQNTQGYWATFSSDYDVEFAEGVEVYTVTVSGNQMTSNLVSNRVPANTGVLINAASNEVSYTYIASAEGLGDNNLYPASKDKAELANHKFYKLAYASDKEDNLGFYWGAENGGAFVSREGSAYLAVPSTAAPARFVFGQPGVATAVENANFSTAEGKKVMMNGVLYIIRDGKTYDSFGRMVK